MWKISKTEYDYSRDWDEWHRRDLEDLVLRDRNHPSVIICSIGNEVMEQWDSTGSAMGTHLADIVRQLDSTHPITSGCNYPEPENPVIQSGALDLIGYNYHHETFPRFLSDFPGQAGYPGQLRYAFRFGTPLAHSMEYPVYRSKPRLFLFIIRQLFGPLGINTQGKLGDHQKIRIPIRHVYPDGF